MLEVAAFADRQLLEAAPGSGDRVIGFQGKTDGHSTLGQISPAGFERRARVA